MNAMTSKKVGTILKNRRVSLKLTQRQIADSLGFDTCQFISNLERGIADIPPKKLMLFSEIYKINTAELSKMVTNVLKNKALSKSKIVFDVNEEGEEPIDPFIEEFELSYKLATDEDQLLCKRIIKKILNIERIPYLGRPTY